MSMVNAGEPSGKGTFSDRIIGAANSTIEISGGTFKVQPNAAFLKPGLSATEKDGTFSITPAETGTVYPARLADQSETPITDLYDKDSYNVRQLRQRKLRPVTIILRSLSPLQT